MVTEYLIELSSAPLNGEQRLTVEINGRTFFKVGHRWKNSQSESEQIYREALEDLLLAVARYDKLAARHGAQTNQAPKEETHVLAHAIADVPEPRNL